MKLGVTTGGRIDLVLGSTGIEVETGLSSAVIVSLLTDARAGQDDVLPDAGRAVGVIPPDRRGWAGDALSEIDRDRTGSHLWLLSREKQTETTRQRAIDYARAALQWMIDDGHVTAIAIDAEWSARGRLDMAVVLTLSDGASETVTIPDYGGVHAV